MFHLSFWAALTKVTSLSRVAEFLALAAVFPMAQLRLCLFHVNKNVTRVVRGSTDAATAEKVGIALEALTRLGCTPPERDSFLAGVRVMLDDIIPFQIDMDEKYSTETVLEGLKGIFSMVL